MTQAFQDVCEVLQTYFDGLYHSDADLLEKAFHPQARYVTVTGGQLINWSMPEYFDVVRKREAPATRNEVRRDEIVSIAFAGPLTATARLRCSIAERRFIDCLTLIKDGDRWQIISKVFHYDVVQP